ncbi:MAG: transposase [bacterium]
MLETIQSEKYTIKQIFKENWGWFYNKFKDRIRENVVLEVKKVLSCKDVDILGYSTYACSQCGHKHKVANTCKSRFCNSCGKVMTDKWIAKAQKSFLNVPYHHVIFSPPEELWLFFAYYRESLDFLFESTNKAVQEWCVKEGFVPGIVEVLHTFGSTLTFHPHIHMILSEGGIGADGNFDFSVWRDCGYFPHKVLKARFKYFLIKSLRDFVAKKVKEKGFNLPNELKDLWQRKTGFRDFFRVTQALYKIVWYVHIGERLSNANFTVRYIGRYAKRPCLSETKILYYNQAENKVVITYHDKLSKADEKITLTIEEFIIRLIRHIPEKGYKMIRYYGIYANRVRTGICEFLASQIIALFGVSLLTFEPVKTWRERMIESTGEDPLLCPYCQIEMRRISITYPSREGPLRTVYFH